MNHTMPRLQMTGKLALLLLLCAGTQVHGMENAWQQLKGNSKRIFTTIKYRLLNGDKLWVDAECDAKVIDYYSTKDKNDEITRQDLSRHRSNLKGISDKFIFIYGKRFSTWSCVGGFNEGKCSDDLKKFKEEVEKIRQP